MIRNTTTFTRSERKDTMATEPTPEFRGYTPTHVIFDESLDDGPMSLSTLVLSMLEDANGDWQTVAWMIADRYSQIVDHAIDLEEDLEDAKDAMGEHNLLQELNLSRALASENFKLLEEARAKIEELRDELKKERWQRLIDGDVVKGTNFEGIVGRSGAPAKTFDRVDDMVDALRTTVGTIKDYGRHASAAKMYQGASIVEEVLKVQPPNHGEAQGESVPEPEPVDPGPDPIMLIPQDPPVMYDPASEGVETVGFEDVTPNTGLDLDATSAFEEPAHPQYEHLFFRWISEHKTKSLIQEHQAFGWTVAALIYSPSPRTHILTDADWFLVLGRRVVPS